MSTFQDKIKKNISLAPYTTFKIGGPAKYFFEAKKIDDIKKAVVFAYQQKLPFFILGHGSNILISDKGFNGLVIKNNCRGYKIEKDIIYAETGMLLSDLLKLALANNLSGLEWAAGIPGTLGGATVGNAGAFNSDIARLVLKAEVLDKNLMIKRYLNREINFKYRSSIFKKNNEIIISAKLKFKKDINRDQISIIRKYKVQKQPLENSSAGCIFKNPDKQKAGYLIEQCGLKGKKIGQAQISKKHANFIINLGSAKASDVIELITTVKTKVKNKFNINLEEEIQIL